jgi:hypothetical protein
MNDDDLVPVGRRVNDDLVPVGRRVNDDDLVRMDAP